MIGATDEASMDFKDYYKVLGIDREASADTIKSAYRKLARKYHPDMNPGDKKAEERFKEINEANEVLGDPEKRKKYDELGSNWEQILREQEFARKQGASRSRGFEGFGEAAGGEDFSDFFRAYFGGHPFERAGFGREGGAAQPGEDTQTDFPLTLEELVAGGKRNVRLSVGELCTTCGGTGHVSSVASGTGRRRTIATVCPTCRGEGQVTRSQTIEVTIPKGLKDGSQIRLAGLGGRGVQGGRPGDLYLRARLQPHRIFRAEGYDLSGQLPVWDDEAVLGAEIAVPTPTGSVVLRVPANSQSGRKLRLKGKGLPKPSGEAAGDLYWEIQVVTPDDAAPKERDLYDALRRLRVERGERDRIRRHLKS
jgi:DnaJ-class molecular chaperone